MVAAGVSNQAMSLWLEQMRWTVPSPKKPQSLRADIFSSELWSGIT
jgi:hypothetical protein